jgi:hypothetical protein
MQTPKLSNRSALVGAVMAIALAIGGFLMFSSSSAAAAPAASPTTSHAAAPAAIKPAVSGGFYQIVNSHSGKCLDVKSEDNYYAVGARVQQYHCTGVLEQHWAIALAADNQYFSLVSQRSGYCMEPSLIPGNINGVQVDQAVCNSMDYQQWRSVSAGTNQVYLVNKNGLCLDVSGGSTADHAKVQLWSCNGTGAQIWKFQ